MPKTVYTADSGDKHPIRIGTAASTFNGAQDGNATSDIKAKVSKGNREAGLRPRMIVISREVSEGGKILYRRVPCLTEAKYDSVTVNGNVTYDGQTWKCISKMPEDY